MSIVIKLSSRALSVFEKWDRDSPPIRDAVNGFPLKVIAPQFSSFIALRSHAAKGSSPTKKILLGRKVHTQNIENLNYEPDGEDGFNSQQVIDYYGNGSMCFKDENLALKYAEELENEIDFVEYGVSKIIFPLTIDQYWCRKEKNEGS